MNRKRSNRFSPEVRERAVPLVQEHRGEYPSLWACIDSIATKIVCVPQTLDDCVKQQEINTGVREGLSTEERAHMKALEREVKELATLQWVHWFNHTRLLEPIGHVPPAEAEANYWRQLAQQAETARST
jgi:transposase